MREYPAEIDELLAEANSLPYSSARLAILQEVVRLADLHQDIDLGIAVRRPLMEVARNLLRGDILTDAFVWCLAQHDRAPERFAGRNLWIEYRWVISQLSNFVDVSRTKLEELLDDFGRRLEAAGYSRRHYYHSQREIAPDLGDQALASAANRAMKLYPRDGLSHDSSWEQAEETQTELFVGNIERALELSRPYLEDRYSERRKSDSVCASLLLLFWQRGETVRAKALHKRCLRSYQPERCYYWWYGELLKFTAIANDLGRAVHLYEECQRAVHPNGDPLTRLHFALDALVVFNCLAAAGRQHVAIRLPAEVPGASTRGQYSVAALQDYLGQEARQLAERFDARNGNSYFNQQLEERAELHRRVTGSA